MTKSGLSVILSLTAILSFLTLACFAASAFPPPPPSPSNGNQPAAPSANNPPPPPQPPNNDQPPPGNAKDIKAGGNNPPPPQQAPAPPSAPSENKPPQGPPAPPARNLNDEAAEELRHVYNEYNETVKLLEYVSEKGISVNRDSIQDLLGLFNQLYNKGLEYYNQGKYLDSKAYARLACEALHTIRDIVGRLLEIKGFGPLPPPLPP